MPRRRAVPETVALLESWLADAKAGLVTDIAVVGRFWTGEYDEEYCTDDLPDLVLEVRSAVIRMQSAVLAAPDNIH